MTAFEESLRTLLDAIGDNPRSARKSVGEMLARDRRQFVAAAFNVLKTGQPTPGHAHLVSVLVENEILPAALSNPDECSLEEAVALARTVSRIDPLVDTKLARWLLRRLHADHDLPSPQTAQRILGILEHITSGNRLTPMLVQLLRVSDPGIRSKVAMLMGRGTKNVGWALSEHDPRVRANAVEAAWGTNSRHTRGFLWELTKDPHNRVAGNALLALHRLGENAAVPALLRMALHSAPMFRATAAWVMGQTQDARFLEALGKMESDGDENVRRNAAQATVRIKQSTHHPAASRHSGGDPSLDDQAPQENPHGDADEAVQGNRGQ
jgi:hypothetical protein